MFVHISEIYACLKTIYVRRNRLVAVTEPGGTIKSISPPKSDVFYREVIANRLCFRLSREEKYSYLNKVYFCKIMFDGTLCSL